MILGNVIQDSIGYMEYGYVLWCELNQHHNSKNKTYDLVTSHFTQITQLKFEYM
jgi:hypothetical protein